MKTTVVNLFIFAIVAISCQAVMLPPPKGHFTHQTDSASEERTPRRHSMTLPFWSSRGIETTDSNDQSVWNNEDRGDRGEDRWNQEKQNEMSSNDVNKKANAYPRQYPNWENAHNRYWRQEQASFGGHTLEEYFRTYLNWLTPSQMDELKMWRDHSMSRDALVRRVTEFYVGLPMGQRRERATMLLRDACERLNAIIFDKERAAKFQRAIDRINNRHHSHVISLNNAQNSIANIYDQIEQMVNSMDDDRNPRARMLLNYYGGLCRRVNEPKFLPSDFSSNEQFQNEGIHPTTSTVGRMSTRNYNYFPNRILFGLQMPKHGMNSIENTSPVEADNISDENVIDRRNEESMNRNLLWE